MVVVGGGVEGGDVEGRVQRGEEGEGRGAGEEVEGCVGDEVWGVGGVGWVGGVGGVGWGMVGVGWGAELRGRDCEG